MWREVSVASTQWEGSDTAHPEGPADSLACCKCHLPGTWGKGITHKMSVKAGAALQVRPKSYKVNVASKDWFQGQCVCNFSLGSVLRRSLSRVGLKRTSDAGLSVGHPALHILVFSRQTTSDVFSLITPREFGNKQTVVCSENTWIDLVRGFLNVLHPKAIVGFYD